MAHLIHSMNAHGRGKGSDMPDPMETPLDHVIPVSVILTRLENHRDEIARTHARTPRWRFVRRQRLLGAQAAYAYEIEQLLEISSGWQPFWQDIGKDGK